VDVSARALKGARLRGLRRTRRMSITEITPALGRFDTVLMLGNNFGLMGNFARARRLLRRFAGMTSARARMIVQSNDVYRTKNPRHLAYQRWNRRRGRMPGQIRFRVRYENLTSGDMDYLMVCVEEMRKIVAGTGWRVARVLAGKGGVYVAVLEKG
jgi:hypothetical protein